MAEIVPAIIPHSFEELEEKVSSVVQYVDTIAIDIMDGIFVPTVSWPFDGGDSYAFQNMIDGNQMLPYVEKVEYEIDMMVASPDDYVENWIRLGAQSFVIHYESVSERIREVIAFLKSRNKKVGIALKPREDISVLDPFMSEIDFVQFMGNDNIGHNGVTLDKTVYEKIRGVKEKFENVTISIDIGVSRETASRLVEAGATKLVSGSGIFGVTDPVEEINFYKSL
ncbi:MAG: hypothetical protein COV34_02590 [Candidatus Zambryskibacteria bacterium CG10_big_fil_rev_8_21_14_0_10_42_12]|uniref:Ribulose-phosphate 3-epimerase n=1 Tax=Candidatus Zambryskibacteria bacterium CG10_big_fil_rev_8_21_14_0_10_42_12 TaxID=1975115 RepID=A0A2H0QUJ6_9BACT|nr:MAG: hypothetical protein COV34_02590 [Candidatus Zambryskibacteria bacterium CG10_big_fil_rev_8_21_14_0_10_42_12]